MNTNNNNEVLTLYVPGDTCLFIVFSTKNYEQKYCVNAEGNLLKTRDVGLGKSALPDYCLDYFWRAQVDDKSSPEKQIRHYDLPFGDFFMTYFYKMRDALWFHDGEVRVEFGFGIEQDKLIMLPGLDERFNLWFKAMRKNVLYVDPFESGICSEKKIGSFLGPILDNSNKKFEDFYEKRNIGMFEVYIPIQSEIDKVREYFKAREIYNELGIKIVRNPGEPIDVVLIKLLNLLGIDYEDKVNDEIQAMMNIQLNEI